MNKPFELFTLTNRATPKFVMTAVELKDYIDFEVKRIYFISKPQDNTGAHCHYEEKEFFIMQQGTCIALIDRGNGIEEFKLEGPQHAIYVPNYVWHGFKDLSDDAILLAITSTNYRPDRSDYLEDYDQYLKIRDEKLK
jgi:dTDP-4-dehydrorhamnose 3,5-epimerase-like enzyme